MTDRSMDEQDARLFQILNSCPVGLAIHRASDRTFVFVNNEFTSLVGWTHEELVGRTASEVGLVQETTAAPLRKRLDAGSSLRSVEIHVRRRTGERHDFLLSTERVEFRGETHFVTSFVDIGERIRTEEALRHHEAVLLETGRIAQVGGWEFDPATGMGTWTDEVARIHELEPGAPMALAAALTYYAGESRGRITAALEQAVAHGTPYDLELELRTPSGQTKWVRTIGRPVVVDDRVVSVRGSFQDITSRRLADQRIEHLNRVYAVLSDINQTIVREKDPTLVLAAACRIAVEKGRFRMAWIGAVDAKSGTLQIAAHAGANHETLSILQLLLAAREGEGCVFTAHAMQAGEHSVCNDIATDPRAASWRDAALARRYLAMASLPLRVGAQVVGTFNLYADEAGFFNPEELRLLDELAMDVGFALEVHERDVARRNTERALRESEDRLRQSQKMESIGQLAGGIAHDFNNLLTVIHGYGALLMGLDQVPADVAIAAQEIVDASARASSLTRQLLAFSRRQVMQPRLLDLNDVVTNLTKMVERIVGEDVHVGLHLHPRPLTVRGDAGMLEQVLMNLVVNARDAMPGGGRLMLQTSQWTFDANEASTVRDLAPGTYACVRVSDVGTGIAPEYLSRIFEPFFTTKAPGRGTGLGLATVYGIVRQHDGAVQVATELGRGTTFVVFLPIAPAAEDVAADDVKAVPAHGGTETILIVEDEPSVRRLTRLVLAQRGYRVLEAADGLEALAIWDSHETPIDLVITDIVMPQGVNGRDLAAQLRERDPGLRVIFTSGYSADLAGQEMPMDERQNFISKPSSPQQLLEMVRRTLDRT